MTQLPKSRLTQARSSIHDILALALLNNMETALTQDFLELLEKIEKDELVYKIEWTR